MDFIFDLLGDIWDFICGLFESVPVAEIATGAVAVAAASVIVSVAVLTVASIQDELRKRKQAKPNIMGAIVSKIKEEQGCTVISLAAINSQGMTVEKFDMKAPKEKVSHFFEGQKIAI